MKHIQEKQNPKNINIAIVTNGYIVHYHEIADMANPNKDLNITKVFTKKSRLLKYLRAIL